MKMLLGIFLTCAESVLLAAQPASGEPNPLLRQYRDGERLIYHMKGTNETWHYRIQAEGVVKKDADGTYFEEYGWSHLTSDDQEAALSAGSTSLRQRVTLDPNRGPVFPNLSQVDPRLVGPMTDFLTFYVDLWLAAKTGRITRPRDHFYFKRGAPNSWADGTADTPNNWVQLQRTKDNRYLAAVGKETFEVQITLSLMDGKILFATMDNPVETLERECADSALTKCSDAKPHLIERRIEISLERG